MSLQTNYSVYRVVHSEMRKMDLQVIKKVCVVIYILPLPFIFNLIRRACGHVDVGTCPHQVLAATLTLSQPGDGWEWQIIPTLYWCPHQDLKATGAPDFGFIGLQPPTERAQKKSMKLYFL